MRARAVVAFSMVVIAATPSVTAQDEASARAEPAVAAEGMGLNLIFTVDAPELVEAIVQPRVTCTIAAPDQTARPVCDRALSPVEARVLEGGARDYAFPYVAPTALGTYRVHFQLTSTLTLLPHTYEADTTFRIVNRSDLPPESGGQGPLGAGGPGGAPGPGGPGQPGPGAAPGTNGPGGDQGKDAQGDIPTFPGQPDTNSGRFYVSQTAGLAPLLLILVARRWPFGGIR